MGGSYAERCFIINDLTYCVALHIESGGPLSLMNIASETLLTRSLVLSLVIIMFTTLSCAAR
jgi:hypothetical protein